MKKQQNKNKNTYTYRIEAMNRKTEEKTTDCALKCLIAWLCCVECELLYWILISLRWIFAYEVSFFFSIDTCIFARVHNNNIIWRSTTWTMTEHGIGCYSSIDMPLHNWLIACYRESQQLYALCVVKRFYLSIVIEKCLIPCFYNTIGIDQYVVSLRTQSSIYTFDIDECKYDK